MAGFFDELALPFGVPTRDGGAKLIARRIYKAVGTVSQTVPVGAGWLSARAWGGGGNGNGSNNGGSGGTFARSDVPCNSGQPLSVKVTGSNGQPSTTEASSVTLGGIVIVSAPTGNINGTLTLNGIDIIGQIIARGGIYGNPGVNGGIANIPGSLNGGGGAGGENNASDILIMAGDGGSPGGFPGGGGNNGSSSGGSGLVFVEFWSAKP